MCVNWRHLIHFSFLFFVFSVLCVCVRRIGGRKENYRNFCRIKFSERKLCQFVPKRFSVETKTRNWRMQSIELTRRKPLQRRSHIVLVRADKLQAHSKLFESTIKIAAKKKNRKDEMGFAFCKRSKCIDFLSICTKLFHSLQIFLVDFVVALAHLNFNANKNIGNDKCFRFLRASSSRQNAVRILIARRRRSEETN